MTSTRILIVDDDLDFAESLADLLEQRNCAVELAQDGAGAIRMVDQNEYHVVLLDVKMPGLNGVEAFLRMKRSRPTLRIILMTAFTIDQLLQQAIENGVISVMRKPVHFETAMEVVNRIKSDGVILFAAADSDFAPALEQALREKGNPVLCVTTGHQALEALQARHVKLLLLDLDLPDQDGVAIVKEIKARAIPVPTILVAGEHEQRFAGENPLPVQDILSKPFDPGRLIGLVEGNP